MAFLFDNNFVSFFWSTNFLVLSGFKFWNGKIIRWIKFLTMQSFCEVKFLWLIFVEMRQKVGDIHCSVSINKINIKNTIKIYDGEKLYGPSGDVRI